MLMSTVDSPRRSQLGRKGLTIVAAMAAAAMLLMSLSMVQKAPASELAAKFCPEASGYMWLDPAWTGNYRCDGADSVSGYGRDRATIYTWERAGCVDYADVWHNLITSWVCIPAGTWGYVNIRQDGGWYRGVIRNNNLTYGAHFYGIIQY